jgi:hypothetical protein
MAFPPARAISIAAGIPAPPPPTIATSVRRVASAIASSFDCSLFNDYHRCCDAVKLSAAQTEL